MDEVGDGYAEKVQRKHGAGEETHADGVRHGADDGCDKKDDEHCVAEVAQQKFGVDDAEQSEEEDEDGEFKADAEAENDGKKEPGVLVDGEDGVETFPEPEDEHADGVLENIVVAKPCAGQGG